MNHVIVAKVRYTRDLFTGIGSGAANVPMMGLVTNWFARSARGKAAGFVVSGSGFAILLSGWLIPYVNGLQGEEGWRLNWILLAAMVLCVAVVCLAVLRDRPEDMGLKRVGAEGEEASGQGGGAAARRRPSV